MSRPLGVKAGKKRKKREEKYDKEEDEQVEMVQEDVPAAATIEETAEDDKVAEDLADDIPGIPVTITKQMSQPGAVFVLERASLEVAKVGKTYQILNSEDHANFLMKQKKNPADYRPYIVHQALLMILDSPLNKAGRIQSVYVKTEKVQLLQKLSISAAGKRDKLFRVVKNPVTQYLPLNSRFSFSSEKLVDIQKYVDVVKDDSNFVFVVGAMAHGKVDDEYVEDYISRLALGQATQLDVNVTVLTRLANMSAGVKTT
uniref:Ribosomal RNA small subunit methyltransferase NEP1 n=1 Tax=Chenopodium quinoa TaxID=63459 RepID=A0A803M264_CHEQI